MTDDELLALKHDCGHEVRSHYAWQGDGDDECHAFGCDCTATHDQAIAYAVTKLLEETRDEALDTGYGWGESDSARD